MADSIMVMWIYTVEHVELYLIIQWEVLLFSNLLYAYSDIINVGVYPELGRKMFFHKDWNAPRSVP